MLKFFNRYIQYIVSSGLILISINSYAQKSKSIDTIYYKLDTLRTPLNDRMISSEKAGDYIFYTIKCACLKEGIRPVFRCNANKITKLDSIEFSHLKCIPLSQLIEIVSKNDDKYFNDKFVVYFIEPYNSNFFIKRKIFFQGSYKTIVN